MNFILIISNSFAANPPNRFSQPNDKAATLTWTYKEIFNYLLELLVTNKADLK